MRLGLSALLLSVRLLPAATLVSSSHEGNLVHLQLSDGSAQLEWLSDSSFRFTRNWGHRTEQAPAKNAAPIPFKIDNIPNALTIATKYLLVTIAKRGVLVRVAEPDATPIMSDLSEAERRDGTLAWERTAAPGVRFYGLGARADAAVELRGSRVEAVRPFLISSAGYGEYHVASGDYSFDLGRAKADRYRIEARGADKLDYYFFFGLAPKEILEQYLLLHDPAEAVMKSGSLAETIHGLINGGMSGVNFPAAALDPYLTFRRELGPYYATYEQETRDRGLPLIRALPMQFPKDADAAKATDEFMLGDELLVAPIYEGQSSRSMYLPMGIWTRLNDNRVFPGRRAITVEGKPGEMVLFSRNGSILPLGWEPMTLHYFPRLGGEFFVFEDEPQDYSQMHAAPVGDLMRLEVESRKDRHYEWILHHVDRPRKVVMSGVEFQEALNRHQLRLQAGGWFYDSPNGNLHVWMPGKAGQDNIVSITF